MRKIFLFLFYLVSVSCTENQRVKNYGGLSRLEIPSDEIFIDATWKQDDLWVTTKKRSKNDTLYQTYYFKEKSSYGVIEGTYEIIEKI